MTRSPRRTLLFIAPIMPQRSGNGLAMRAGMMLEGLARRFDVHLLVLPVSGGDLTPPDFVRQLTVKVGVLDLGDAIDPHAALIARIADPTERRRQQAAYPRPWASRFSGVAAARQAVAFMAGSRIDALHVMRLYLAPLALHLRRALAAPAPVAWLDLDDDDACVHLRLAALHDLRGDQQRAAADRAEACKYAACAASVLGEFGVVLTASQQDAGRLAAAYPGVRFATVPNGYRAGPPHATPARLRQPGGPLRLLFVANLGYFPNADAAAVLVDDILPALRDRGADVDLDIVGPGATTDVPGGLARADGDSRIALHGKVESVSPWYAQADIAVAPLRAGGGTRIKILEAFAHGIPVVSSRLGAEGLDAVHGRHLLCADDAGDFATACLRLAADPGLAADLVANADELLRLHYTPDRVHAKIDALVDSVGFEGHQIEN